MIKKTFAAVGFIVLIVSLNSGCAFTRNSDHSTPGEFFMDMMYSLLCPDRNEEMDDIDRWRKSELKTLEAKREWQKQNLSEAERKEMGLKF